MASKRKPDGGQVELAGLLPKGQHTSSSDMEDLAHDKVNRGSGEGRPVGCAPS